MIVIMGNRAYECGRGMVRELLKIASDSVPLGIYALEKNGVLDMRNDKYESRTRLKEKIRTYKRNGYKVYANR